MLEFILFFGGIGFAATFLVNYFDKRNKRKARLKRIEQEHIRESEIAQLAERQRERERQHEQLVREQIELAKQRALESIKRQREEEQEREEARRAAQKAKEMERAQKEAEKAAKREFERQQAEADLEHYAAMRENYTNLIESMAAEAQASTTTEKRRNTLQRQILQLEEKVYKIDQRRAKAYYLAKGVC